MDSLLNGTGKVKKKDMVKIEAFNSCFTVFLTPKILLLKGRSKEVLLSVEEDDLKQCINWSQVSVGYSLSRL